MTIHRHGGQDVVSTTHARAGLVGTLAFRFIDLADGTAESARLTTGIVERPPGLYIATRPAPTAPSLYAREWWDGTQAWYDDDDLEVTA